MLKHQQNHINNKLYTLKSNFGIESKIKSAAFIWKISCIRRFYFYFTKVNEHENDT